MIAPRRVPVSPDRVILGGVDRYCANATPCWHPDKSSIEVVNETVMTLVAQGQCKVCNADAAVITRGLIFMMFPDETTMSGTPTAKVDGF
jgi:hypothetical protein